MAAPPVAPPIPAPLPPANPPAVGKLQRKSDEMRNRTMGYRRGKQALTIPVGGVGSTGTGVGY